jgi:hypothetical protein
MSFLLLLSFTFIVVQLIHGKAENKAFQMYFGLFVTENSFHFGPSISEKKEIIWLSSNKITFG